MVTQKFLPNEADAFHANQAEPDSVDFEILLLGYQRTGVLSGCAVTESSPAAQTVDVALGTVALAGAQITVSVQADVAVSAADGSNPRIDLISVNSSGTVVVTAGTPAAQPVAPAIPATSVPLAFLYLPANDNTHADNQINDKRVVVVVGLTYYVDQTGGSDSVDGLTTATAWKTISKVNGETFNPGDTILFKKGETWREQLTVPSGGTPGDTILFGTYGSGAVTPRITGTDLLTGWTLDSGSIYTATFDNGITTFLLLENGVPLKRRTSQGAVVGAGEFFADDGANTIYAWATDSADPDTHTMEIGARYNTMIASGKNHLVFDGIHFHGAGGEFGSGARIDNQGSHVVFASCEMSGCHYTGSWLLSEAAESGPDDITYLKCDIHDCVVFGISVQGQSVTNRLNRITLDRCHVHDCGDPDTAQHAVSLKNVLNASVFKSEVDNNVGSQAWGGGLYLDHAPLATIHNSSVHDNDPQGCQVDVNSNEFSIRSNEIYDNVNNGLMIEDHLTAAGLSEIIGNDIHGNVRGLVFGPGGVDFEVSGVTVYGNYVHDNTSSAWGLDATGGTLADYFVNTVDFNVYWGNGDVPTFHTDNPANDYNLPGWRTVTAFDTDATYRLRGGVTLEESTATTLTWDHGVLNVDTSGGAVVITLPDNAAFDGKNYLIRRDGASTVTIDRAGSDTFDDGDTAKTLDSDSAAIGIFSIGDTEWKIVATEGTVGGS